MAAVVGFHSVVWSPRYGGVSALPVVAPQRTERHTNVFYSVKRAHDSHLFTPTMTIHRLGGLRRLVRQAGFKRKPGDDFLSHEILVSLLLITTPGLDGNY